MFLTQEDILSPEFFAKLLPSLSFNDEIPAPPTTKSPPQGWHETLVTRGFVRELPNEIWEEGTPAEMLGKISAGLTLLSELGLPLGLLICSCEAVAIGAALGKFVRAGMSDNEFACIGDWAFFHVDCEKKGSKGWPPHRDRSGVANALDPVSFAPRYITCWVPLSSATPYTSCLYFLPREHDPGYEAGDEKGSDPVTSAFATPDSFQNIVGLPTPRGGLLAFSSRTLHWGSAPLQRVVEGREARPPRQALSIAFAKREFESPALLRRGAEACPTFRERVLLLCGQSLLYHNQAPLSPQIARVFLEVIKSHGEGVLDAGYRARVEKAGAWVTFSTAFSNQRGERTSAPSAGEIALVFAARAGVEGGFDSSSYI